MRDSFEHFYELLTQHLQEGVCFVDADRRITLWNHAAEQLTGVAAAAVVGSPCAQSVLSRAIPGHDPQEASDCPFEHTINSGTPHAYRLFLDHAAGHRLLIQLRIIPLTAAGDKTGAIGIFSDAASQSELLSTTRAMQTLMRIDPLTHLPNKRSVNDSMKGEYLRYARYGTPFALILLSIDPDDALTAESVDRDALLKWFAQQLSVGLRKADTIGRLRGVMFLALLPHANTQAAEKAAEKLRQMFARLPYPATGSPLSVSFGCASIARSDTLERLLERARSALRAARTGGGDRVVSL